MKVFRGKLESACLSIYVSVSPCVCPSVYKILVSVKALAGVVTALVFSKFKIVVFKLLLFEIVIW